ncbi:hypothetical protein [Actinomadura sp. 9N215]|uniref:hypothetical protein n=1 Tax=Actinomadura sp. 9N215 TaxID=3375150 RepID=UPI00379F948D
MTHQHIRKLAVATMAAGTMATMGTVASAPAIADGPGTASARHSVTASAATVTQTASAAQTTAAKASCRNAVSKITGSTVTARICWQGKKVWVTGVMYDTKGDNRKACVKVRYVKNAVRTTMRACIKNSKPGKSQKWSDNQPKASKYVIQACTRNTLKTSCDSKWR